MAEFLIQHGVLTSVVLLIILIILLIPYSYVFTRFISKAWHKSKNEEKKYE